MLEELGKRAQDAAVVLAGTDEKTRNGALEAIASALEANTAAILAANERDMALGREAGLRQALLEECPDYRIRLIDAPLVDISSTQIREMQAQGLDASAWLM